MSVDRENIAAADAAVFHNPDVVAAYRYRPPYPEEVFDLLTNLITVVPHRVLDVGCGSGEIARYLVRRVEHVDAVDFSSAMIETGKQLPGGHDPRLRWLCGAIEDAPLDPPYALITAGASLHWMAWPVVFPRLQAALACGGYLVFIEQRITPDVWSALGDIIPRYRVDTYRAPARPMIEELQQRGFFQAVGERVTEKVPFAQSIDAYIASYHSRVGFARERLGKERAAAFDQEARRSLIESYPNGSITLQVAAQIVWGIPVRTQHQSFALEHPSS